MAFFQTKVARVPTMNILIAKLMIKPFGIKILENNIFHVRQKDEELMLLTLKMTMVHFKVWLLNGPTQV